MERLLGEMLAHRQYEQIGVRKYLVFIKIWLL